MVVRKYESFTKLNNNQKFHIFLDMDGVICDFVRRFIEIEKNTERLSFEKYLDKYGKIETWQLVTDEGVEWWSEMNWMKDGKELWDYVKQYNPTILSAPSRDRQSAIGKVIWVNRELGLDIKETTRSPKPHRWDENSRMILNSDKYLFCKRYPNSILIDDTPQKINDWIDKGGIGILHTNTKDTIEKLEQIILNF